MTPHLYPNNQEESTPNDDFDSPRNIAGFVVDAGVFSILAKIKHRYPQVFTSLIPQSQWCAASLLDGFAKFIESLSQLRVEGLQSEKIENVLAGLRDFERNGFDVSWIRGRFEDARSVSKLKEAEEALKATETLILRQENDLLNLKLKYAKDKDILDREKGMVKFPLAHGDFILKDMIYSSTFTLPLRHIVAHFVLSGMLYIFLVIKV